MHFKKTRPWRIVNKAKFVKNCNTLERQFYGLVK